MYKDIYHAISFASYLPHPNHFKRLTPTTLNASPPSR